jgi:integrase
MDEWLDQWITAKRDISQRTRDSYESVGRLHLRPHLGTVQLDKLTSAHVAAMFDAIEARNADPRRLDDSSDVRSRKAKVTLPTQYKIRKVLAMVLRSAIEHRLIERMPAGWGNLLPSPPKRPPTVWTPEQVNRFLDATHDERLYALWWLALLHGPRRSELLAMRWADVDWQVREIVIPGSKTDAGIRSIPLSEEGVGILRAHRKRQAEERLAAFGAYDDHDLVFCREDGSSIPGHQITFGFQRLARELGLPVIRFHDARHTAATLGLEAGVDVIVMSRMLGHADVRITMDTYQHVRRQVFDDATAKVDALLAANRSGNVRESGQ